MKSCQRFFTFAIVMLAAQLPAQTLNVLYAFTNTPDGANPRSGVIWNSNLLYGTTYSGGTNSDGTIFRLSPDGLSYTNLKIFIGSPADGRNPNRGLLLVSNTFYGTTYYGGSNGYGVVFKMNLDGSGYSLLKQFNKSPDAENPSCVLILGSNTLYGTTQMGGTNGLGAIFKLDTNGSNYAQLYSFAGTPDGAYPIAGLVLGGDTLYGMTSSGGTNGVGTVFKINTDGSGYTELKSFAGYPDGSTPYAGLVLAGNTLYGTTSGGGTNAGGTVFKININGSGYAILKHCSAATGSAPWADLTLNGNTLYGTTTAGGVMPDNFGTVFKVNTDGSGFALLGGFNQTNGQNPDLAGVIMVSNTLYGTTYDGGTNLVGVVFSLSLPPFPSLQISNAAAPLVYWTDDGLNRVLQTTTNLASGSWSNVTKLNYTNSPVLGLTITNPVQPPQAFFRLE
jgi:uncharacterized repeat protein (TIGR03803 family)